MTTNTKANDKTSGPARSTKPTSGCLKDAPDGRMEFEANRQLGRAAAGSASDDFSIHLTNTTLQACALPGDRETVERMCRFNIEAAAAFGPTDEVEGMMAAQAVAMHNMSMECARRAMVPGQPADIAAGQRKAAANSSRTFIDLVDALARRRGKGPQVVRVERVVIHEGGQAIVGNVIGNTGGGGSAREIERRAHEPLLGDGTIGGAIGTSVRGQGAQRTAVLRTGDAEQQVPNPRREKHRSANR